MKKNKYGYNGGYEKIFFTAKEVADIIGAKYKFLKEAVKELGYRRVGGLYEIPKEDVEKIKSFYQKTYGKKTNN